MQARSGTPICYGPEAPRSRMPLPAPPSDRSPARTSGGVEHSAWKLASRLQAGGHGQLQMQPQVGSPRRPPATVGGRCETCLRCLQDLKRQTFQLIVPNPKSRDLLLKEQPNLLASVLGKLRMPVRYPENGHCPLCDTSSQQLKLEAVHMVQSMSTGSYAAQTTRQQQQCLRSNSSSSVKSVSFASNVNSPSQSRPTSNLGFYSPNHRFVERSVSAPQGSRLMQTHNSDSCSSPVLHSKSGHRMSSTPPSSSAGGVPGSSTRKKRKHHNSELVRFNTKFAEVIRHNPPPIPPNLLNVSARTACQNMAKVKVIVKVVSKDSTSPPCVSVDSRRKQVTVFDHTTHHRNQPQSRVPKMFAYDSVFAEESCVHELSSSALVDIVQGVVNGTDGCVFVFGYGKLGKTQTMLGCDSSSNTLGVIPRAISWLFQCIQEQKEKSSARFSVRVSAVEISGKDENLKDLLSDVAKASDASAQTSPAVYLREDPISGTQIENQSELRAPSAEKAAYYLDAALNARTQPQDSMSHLLVTLHVYQYRVEKCGTGSGVAGGRSRLHLIDLGSGRTSKDQGSPALSLAALGSVLMALMNGQRHIPHRESKLSQLLREALGSLACRACMICQVSSSQTHQSESLQVLQLGSKIQRLRRRKTKFASNSSDSSSCDSFGVRRAGRLRPQMGTLRDSCVRLNALTSQSETDYSSSSEQSCNTVIFMGKNGELTDNEHPPQSLLRKLAQASSGDDSDTGTETGSAHSGRRNMPRTNAKVRPPAFNRLGKMNAVEIMSTQKEQWIDGPNAQVAAAAAAKVKQKEDSLTRPTRVKEEIVEAVPVNPKERWIDGPNASPPSTEERRKSIEMATDASVINMAPRVKKETDICDPPCQQTQRRDAETQVEEPYESESSTSTYSTLDRKNQRVLSDISEKTEDTSGKSGAEVDDDIEDGNSCNEALEEMEIPSLPLSSATADRPKKSKVLGPLSSLPRQKTLHSDMTTSMTSAVSAPGADMSLSHKSAETYSHSHHKSSDPLVARVKPFVRDWVEKHSVISSSDSCCNDDLDKQCHADSTQSSPVHTMKEGICPSSIQSTPTHQSMVHSKHTSRSRSVKCKKPSGEGQPGAVPTATNYARVAQWLQDVNPDERRHTVQHSTDKGNSKSSAQQAELHSHQRSASQTSESKLHAPLKTTLHASPAEAVCTTPSKSTLKQRDRSTSSHKRDKSKEKKEEKKSRLTSFLTSPLFGKKSKDKTEKLITKPSRKSRKAPSNCALLSPYHTITQPRVSVHSSSGHGSDCSYNIYGINRRHGVDFRQCVTGGASSGYESMLRDSEASSCQDTASEKSLQVKNSSHSRVLRKRVSASAIRKNSRSRSRSAPPGSHDGSISDEETETKMDERVDIERQIYYEKINELLSEQDVLKEELMSTKTLLMVDRSTWGFDLHVADGMDPESAGFLESLKKETEILRKRVYACKSHVSMMTCFDYKVCAPV